MGVSRPKRSFDREFKLQVVRQLLSGEKRLAQLCREHQLSATLARRWTEQYDAEGEAAWPEFGSLVVTPDTEHGFAIYPNLLSDRGWRELTGPTRLGARI